MNSFQTCISSVEVDQNKIVHVIYEVSTFTVALFEKHYQTMNQMLGHEKRMFIYYFAGLARVSVSREAKNYNNQEIAKITESLAFVSTSGMLRIFVSLQLKIAGFKFPYKILQSKEEAIIWSLKRRSVNRVKDLKKATRSKEF
ncbi:MAG: hypothetical protein KJ941_13295 [Bacteroidetes bacterium]|nr:hypothetical protein [Bacteroidota bacterium]